MLVNAETLPGGSNTVEVDCGLSDNAAVANGRLAPVRAAALN